VRLQGLLYDWVQKGKLKLSQLLEALCILFFQVNPLLDVLCQGISDGSAVPVQTKDSVDFLEAAILMQDKTRCEEECSLHQSIGRKTLQSILLLGSGESSLPRTGHSLTLRPHRLVSYCMCNVGVAQCGFFIFILFTPSFSKRGSKPPRMQSIGMLWDQGCKQDQSRPYTSTLDSHECTNRDSNNGDQEFGGIVYELSLSQLAH
jgi:hypothetical protein